MATLPKLDKKAEKTWITRGITFCIMLERVVSEEGMNYAPPRPTSITQGGSIRLSLACSIAADAFGSILVKRNCSPESGGGFWIP